jgi:internalin A
MLLSSWDFGGQEIYHATHQFFLSDRSLFVLLWNRRLGWEQAKLPYWLDIIKARAPHSRVILVATHAEGRPIDLPLAELRATYPQIVGSARVDNRTTEGIEELRHMMAVEAAQLPLMGSRWPLTWATGVAAVTKCGLQHSTPEDLHRRLAGTGVTDSSHQTYLLRALHLLGDILYFDEDEELHDTIIVRPQWVNGYIAKVLDSPEVAMKHGLLTRSHERQLWSDLDPGLRDRFLRMMEKFDLSYRITDDATAASLVVERLPWDSPPYQEPWAAALSQPGGREIRIRYRLNTIPPGIPTWFIAREHRFATGTHWRSGALLRHETDDRVLGLIRAERYDKTVELAVRGPAPQLFFSVLQDGFESTLRRYQGLEVTRLVPCNCNTGDGTQPGQPCIHMYKYGPLRRRLELSIPEVECELSFSKVSVAELLFGIAPTPSHILARRLESIDGHLNEFRTEVAWANREFLKTLRRSQTRAEALCPSIFTLTSVDDGRRRRPGIYRLALRLYCEQPGSFHALPSPPYIINQPAQWLVSISPYLKVLLTMLKHVVPLISPILGLSSDHLAKQLTYEMRLMTELVAQLPEGTKIDRLQEEHTGPAELEADYRALSALLHELDPGEHWAGLSRTYTPEGEILWLCRDHAQQYKGTKAGRRSHRALPQRLWPD